MKTETADVDFGVKTDETLNGGDFGSRKKSQSLIKQSYSTVSDAQNSREFFLGPFSSHDEFSNDNHAHFVESN